MGYTIMTSALHFPPILRA